MRGLLWGTAAILVLVCGVACGQECTTGNVGNALGFEPDFLAGQMEMAYLIHN